MQWKRRHVVLANGKLSYFKIQGSDTEAYVLRGEVPINGMTSVIRDRHSHSHPLLKRAGSGEVSHSSCHFAISGMKASGAPYVFEMAAQDTKERDEWFDAIQVKTFPPAPCALR
jgi:hypothetical protein